MDINPVEILIHIINIAVLFVLLRLILWKHISAFLSARTERVRAELDNAAAANAEAEALKLEYSKGIENLESRGREIIRESQMRAAEQADEIIKDAKAEAERLLGEARERIAEERERAVLSAQNEIAQLATDMAARILKREVLPDDSVSAAEDFFREMR